MLREAGSGTRSAFEAALAAMRVDPAALDVVLTLPSNEAVRAALEADLLHHVRFPLPERAFSAVWHPQRHRSRLAATLLDMIGTRVG